MKRLVLLLCALAVALGCGKHAYGRKELDETTHYYYNDLRWGRLGNVAARVHPDMRQAFLDDWGKRAGEVQLEEIEIVDVREDLDHDLADVTLSVSWVERSSMQLRTATVVQKWFRTDEGWRAGDLVLQ